MSTKTILLTLCVALALLVGCGRSKPPSSKTATAEAVEEDAVTAQPADALPPKSPATPVAAPPLTAPPPAQPVSFGPLPQNRGMDPVADAERQNMTNVRAKQADALAREREQRAAQLQNQPESNDGQ